MTSQKAFCVHGHFYQPVRDDPLTGEIPLEPGAAPFPNWNERIYQHCYRPNAELGNFERISFNIGPTLFNWMSVHHTQTCEQILEQEYRNVKRYGVGNAMAQPYHHTILPLASHHDRVSEVLWGIADFEKRYGHTPSGMWLPEAAVDEETLEVLVDCGMQFTILAPWQAAEEGIDVTQPYWIELPNNKAIVAFFYQPELSSRISFDPAATSNGDVFYHEILASQYRNEAHSQERSQLLVMASDGELYGHHQPFRDRFLSYLTTITPQTGQPRATYPALWLEDHRPTRSMKIRNNTSWSCHHGIMRWAGHCGCTPHGEWKAYLRQAVNFVARAVDEIYVDVAAPLVGDPWELRHHYIQVLLGNTSLQSLIRLLTGRTLPENQLRKIDLLLGAQHERMRMFTSCGWFFEDFDRIEPRNVVAYAAQAIWLTYVATELDLTTNAQAWFYPVQSWVSGVRADAVFNQRLQKARQYFEKMNYSIWVPG